MVPAIALSGCVEIQTDTAAQQQTIGSVRVTTTVCASKPPPQQPCPASNTNGGEQANDPGQLLIAYRVPDGVGAPSEITVTRGSETPLQLGVRPEYAASLQEKSPAGTGLKWVGYISRVIASSEMHQGETFTVTSDFTLPRGSDGSPYPDATFAWRTVAGYRTTSDAASANRPVACGADGTTSFADQGPMFAAHTVCIDSPKPYSTTTPTQSIGIGDLGVLNGDSPVSAGPGQAISVPFIIRTSGNGLPLFDLSAGTTAPNTAAASSTSSFAPSPGDATVPVSVNVGTNTPPGTYDVTLTARVGGVQQRTGTLKLNVVAGDTVPPQIAFALAGKTPKLKSALKKGLKFTVACDEACSALITLKKGKTTVAAGKADKLAPAGGTFTVTVKFSKKIQKKYARTKKLKLNALLAVKDGAGLSSRATKLLTLKR